MSFIECLHYTLLFTAANVVFGVVCVAVWWMNTDDSKKLSVGKPKQTEFRFDVAFTVVFGTALFFFGYITLGYFGDPAMPPPIYACLKLETLNLSALTLISWQYRYDWKDLKKFFSFTEE